MKKILFVLAFMGCLFLPNLSKAQCMMNQVLVNNSLSCPVEVTLYYSGCTPSSVGPTMIFGSGSQCITVPTGCTLTSMEVEDPTGGGDVTFSASGCVSRDDENTSPGTNICGHTTIGVSGCATLPGGVIDISTGN